MWDSNGAGNAAIVGVGAGAGATARIGVGGLAGGDADRAGIDGSTSTGGSGGLGAVDRLAISFKTDTLAQ
jgi:hypothetical protein